MTEEPIFAWRGAATDAELAELTRSHGGRPEGGWWDRVAPHSLGWQHQGIGTEVVRVAAQHAQTAGCEWLHVDFTADLAPFYLEACGFNPAAAGLIHLRNESTPA